MSDSGRTVYGAAALNSLASSITYELIPETQELVWLNDTPDSDGNFAADLLFVDLGMTQNAGNAFTPAAPRATSLDPLFTFAEDGLYLNYLYLFFAPPSPTPTRGVADATMYDNQWFNLDACRPSHLQNVCSTWMAPQSAGDQQATIQVSNYIGPNKVELWTATFTSVKIGAST